MKTENKELTIEQETVKDCPILYKMRFRPMTETCMCWGWEFSGHGFDRATQEMSYEMETLNEMFYPKYRVRIQLDQIKSKFGLFTCYHSVVVDHGKILTCILGNLQRFADFCNSHEFKYERIQDVAPYDYDDVRELSKEDYEDRKNDKYKCSNVEYKEENGKYLEIVHLRSYGKFHNAPTQNKLWYKIGNIVERLIWKIDYMFERPNSKDTRRIVNYLDTKAEEIIRKTEEKCSKVCEECGSHIGSDWSPACQTAGWISYVCERCAEKSERRYYKNGKMYHGNEEVRSDSKTEDKA